jgi:two-component system sensor histidine kinase DesK
MTFTAMLTKLWASPWIPSRYGKAPYFWMLSFVIFGWKYLYETPSILEVTMILLSLVIFLPLYLYSFWGHGWRVVLCIVAIAGLGLGWAKFNFGGSSFIIFAATMCSRFDRKQDAYLGLCLVLVTAALASYLFQFATYFWIPAVIFSIPSAMGAIIGEQLGRANEKIFRKQEEIEHLAALAERERIARDLHDLLGHTLSVITLKAELARKLFDKDQLACQREIVDIENTARQALAEVRSAVLGYRDTGLAHELRGAKNTLASAQVELQAEVETVQLPPAIENIIALALREAVTNIIRHSNATVVDFSLKLQEQGLCFHFADNGNVDAKSLSTIQKGNGLTGMRERVRAMGGEMTISIDHGVAITIQIPMQGTV